MTFVQEKEAKGWKATYSGGFVYWTDYLSDFYRSPTLVKYNPKSGEEKQTELNIGSELPDYNMIKVSRLNHYIVILGYVADCDCCRARFLFGFSFLI